VKKPVKIPVPPNAVLAENGQFYVPPGIEGLSPDASVAETLAAANAEMVAADKARGYKTVTVGRKSFPTYEFSPEIAERGKKMGEALRAEVILALRGTPEKPIVADTVQTKLGLEVTVPIRDKYPEQLADVKRRMAVHGVLQSIAAWITKLAKRILR